MAITAEFDADFTKWRAATQQAQTDLDGLVSKADQLTLEKGAEAAGKAIGDFSKKLIDAGSEWVTVYAAEEAATKRLTTALQTQGNASETVKAKYADMARQFQDTTKYSTTAITSAQALFTQVGQLGPEQMEPAIKAATDLASGLGINLQQAVTMLARAASTGGESLGKLNAILGTSHEKGDDFNTILGEIEAKMGGQAVGEMDTFAGQQAKLNNLWDEAKGKIGSLIALGLTPLLELFNSLPGPVQQLIATAGLLVAGLTPVVIAFSAMVTAITPFIPLITGAVAALGGLTALLTGGLIVAGLIAIYEAWKHWDQIVAICKSVYDGVKTWLVDKLDDIVNWVKAKLAAVVGAFQAAYDAIVGHSIVPDMIDGIGGEFDRLDSVMVAPAQQAAKAVTDALNSIPFGSQSGDSIAFDPNDPTNRWSIGNVGSGLSPGMGSAIWDPWAQSRQAAKIAQVQNAVPGNYVTVAPGAVTMNYPIVDDPKAMDRLGDVAGQAILNRLNRQG